MLFKPNSLCHCMRDALIVWSNIGIDPYSLVDYCWLVREYDEIHR